MVHRFINDTNEEEELWDGRIIAYNPATKNHTLTYTGDTQEYDFDLTEDIQTGDLCMGSIMIILCFSSIFLILLPRRWSSSCLAVNSTVRRFFCAKFTIFSSVKLSNHVIVLFLLT